MTPLSRRAVLAGAAALVPALPAVAQLAGLNQYGLPDPVVAPWRQLVLHHAASLRGQSVGGGECTHFVTEVFRRARLPSHESSLQWGRPWNGPMMPGLVMQMHGGARWEGPNGWFATDNQHTLILYAPAGGQRWQVIHQNWGQRRVTVDTLDFGWRQVRGRTQLWHPWA